MNWIQKLEPKMAQYLHQYREIPDLFGYYSPTIATDYGSGYLFKILPSDNNLVLHQELSLLDKGVDLITLRLQAYDKIHLFDLASTTGDSILPLTLELLHDERVVKYVPITPNNNMNEYAEKKLLAYVLHSKLRTFQTDRIRCELEFTDCRGQVLDVIKGSDPQTTANIFLLLDSRLGNSLNPFQFLSNIYKSMGQGDYLTLVQSIYRQGTEQMHVSDFRNMLLSPGSFVSTEDLIANFYPKNESSKERLIVDWNDPDDQYSVGTVKFKIKMEEEKSVFGVDLSKGDEVSIFRSNRFDRYGLEKLIRSVGFKVLEINFDGNDDNILFFLRKL